MEHEVSRRNEAPREGFVVSLCFYKDKEEKERGRCMRLIEMSEKLFS